MKRFLKGLLFGALWIITSIVLAGAVGGGLIYVAKQNEVAAGLVLFALIIVSCFVLTFKPLRRLFFSRKLQAA